MEVGDGGGEQLEQKEVLGSSVSAWARPSGVSEAGGATDPRHAFGGFQTEAADGGEERKVEGGAAPVASTQEVNAAENGEEEEAGEAEATGTQYPESGVEEKETNPDVNFSERATSEEDCDGTVEEQMAFIKELETFFKDRNLEFKRPKFYNKELNCLKLWKAVMKLGGHERVTARKLWRQVGEAFNPPTTCTTISWSFRGFYEKALLEYERFKTGVSVNYEAGDPSSRGENQDGLSPAATQPSSGGRARRDAAARAMQGWHAATSARNLDIEPPAKDKSSTKRDKRAKNPSLFKRKDGGKGKSYEEDGLSPLKKKMAKQEVMKAKVHNGIDLEVIDEGPQADWVKINVHQTRDCFEVYALVPGLLREEVRIQCEGGGRLVIAGEPEQPENPWGVTAFRKVINLPLRIDAHQTSAVVTLHGQLFVRVPFAQPDPQQ